MDSRRGFLSVCAALAVAGAARADQAASLVEQMRQLRRGPADAPAAPPAVRPYVILRRFVCESSGAGPDDLTADLAEARGVFAACGLDVRAEAPVTIASDYGPPAPCQLDDDHGLRALTPDEEALFQRYNRPDGTLHVFYLSFRGGPDGSATAGTSFPSDYIRLEKGDAPRARAALGAVVVFHKARRFMGSRYVLAHEMGHVLLDDSRHRDQASNLMRGWDGGGRLDKAQCLTVRASPYVRRD
jgi:hypothetical protein